MKLSSERIRGLKRPFLFLVVLLLLLVSSPSGLSEDVLVPTQLLKDVQALSSPEMEGRGVGTAGIDRAARYLAQAFQEAGLRPGGEGKSYLQPFSVTTGVRLGEGNRLVAILRPGLPGIGPYAVREHFSPFSFSDVGDLEAEVVFVGYGITTSELQYDDYAGVDVRGKVVLAMTHEPREKDEKGPFRSPEAYRYTEVIYKVINAREHEAKGILIVGDPLGHPGEADELFGLGGASYRTQKDILAVNVRREVAESLLKSSGKSLAGLQGEIDRDLHSRSFLIPGVKVRLQVSLVTERGKTANVVGILPGRDDPFAKTAIVIGAHYDHLGLGGEMSLAPSKTGQVHPGADDNASGVAALLGLARAFAKGGGIRRTLIFAAFSGEEMGLLGSSHFVRAPPFPIDQVVAMVNLDMVGRMRDGTAIVQGVDTGKEFREVLSRANRTLGLRLKFGGDGYGPSDHTPFYAKDRPVLFFFTGPHFDYHRPTDEAAKINAEGLSLVARLVYETVREIDQKAVTFVRVPGRPAEGLGRGVGYGPYFGSIPDFSETGEDGVRLLGVRPGSPAEQGGLKAGDVIVEFAGHRVRNLHDLIFALRGKRPGETVTVTYLRAGERIEARAKLERRQ